MSASKRRRRQPDAGPEALDQRLLQPGLARARRAGCARPARRRRTATRCSRRRAGPAARPRGCALEPVPARAQAGDDARVRDRRGGPLAAPVDLRDHAALGPAPQRRRRDAHALGSFVEGEGLLCHGLDLCNGGVEGHSAVACGRAGPLRRASASRSTSRRHSIAASAESGGSALNYFVTGATGFIGRHLLAELLEARGDHLRAGARGLARQGRLARAAARRRRGPHRPGDRRPLQAGARHRGLRREPIDHFFHLAGDLRHGRRRGRHGEGQHRGHAST